MFVVLTLMVLVRVVREEGKKGEGAKWPLCSGCLPGSENNTPTWREREGWRDGGERERGWGVRKKERESG